MKRLLSPTLLCLLASTAFAVLFTEFESWDVVMRDSRDIIIARCIATPGFTAPGVSVKPTWNIGGGAYSDIEVVAVFKGSTRLGTSHMASWYKPRQGQRFLLFANYMTYGTNSWYNAIEEYRVVPLAEDFNTNTLTGKTLDEQIEIILAARYKDLNREVAQINEEMKRIQGGIKSSDLTNSPAGPR